MSLYRLFTRMSQWSYVLNTASQRARRKLEAETRHYFDGERMCCRRSLAIVLCFLACFCCSAVDAKVVRTDSLDLQDGIPTCQWRDDARPLRAVILAIHGLALHGSAYDRCARQLAGEGVLFIAPDLRGYGRSYTSRVHSIAEYDQSENDLFDLSRFLRSKYKDVPFYLVGESLGGSLAIKLAAQHPELFDGLILAAPAIKHRYHFSFKSAVDTAVALAVPGHQIDFCPYIRNYFSDEPAIADEEMNDPLVRKTLRLSEIMSSCHLIATTAERVRTLSPDLPLLIIQGQKDLMIGRNSISVLQQNLPGNETSIRIFPQRGHILLETAHVHPEVMRTVEGWISQRISTPNISRRVAHGIADSGGMSSSSTTP